MQALIFSIFKHLGGKHLGAIIGLGVALVVGGGVSCTQKASSPQGGGAAGAAHQLGAAGGADVSLKSLPEQYSYALGFQVGQNIQQQGQNLNQQAFLLAVRDVFSGTKARLDNEARRQALIKMASSRREQRSKEAEVNLQKSTSYLASNKKRKGVKVTKSGLQYRIIKKGSGTKPTKKSSVKVHYKGQLIDGKEFDSSHKRGQPARFPVSGVIPGWTEALQMMRVGSEWELVIPPNLAYGDRNMPNIPPQSTLVFNVQLLGVEGATN